MSSRRTVVLVSLLVATPAVIFCLWLVIKPARMAKLCPEECMCEPGGYYVECLASGLNNFPLIFPTDVRKLVLYANSITTLKKDSFTSRGLTELEELIAGRCEIKRVELGAFNGVTHLRKLSMWGNVLSEIIPGTFEKMSRLEYLDLRGNRIENLEVCVFLGLINLKYIGLKGNKLQYLHPDLFVGLPNLEYLDLADNPHLHVPTDRHFFISHSLSRVDIWGCNVSSVSVETFANVTPLERLDLSYNNLSSVDINILKALPKLSALYLYGNPLQCDCQLQEVWRWCQEHNIQTETGEEAPECDTPSEVQGMWWGVLEKGQCLQGNMYYYGDYKNTSYSYSPIEDTDLYEYYIDALEMLHVPACYTMLIFGTIGNIIIFIIITCNKDMRTVPNMYILNLAVSDIINLVIHFYVGAVYQNAANPWQYGDFMCKFFPFCYRLSVHLTGYSVAVLSIQRYRVTVDPFHVRVSSQPTWRATVATICGVWIVAAVFALPSGLSQHICLGCIYNECQTYYRMVLLFELLVSYGIPLFVIAFFYIMTARNLVNSAVPMSDDTQHPQMNTRKNTANILLGLTVVFVFSFLPCVLLTYSLFIDISELQFWHSLSPVRLQYVIFIAACLLLTNSCLNPVALFCTSRAFRRHLKRYLTCWCCKRTRVTDSELTKKN